jgi:hypothetical protein
MSRGDVIATLGSAAASTVVLGDVNARLLWLQTQSGRPGPPEKVEALSDFARLHRFTTLQSSDPDALPRSGLPAKVVLGKLLTVDHCFVKSSHVADATLLLLDNLSIGVPTDHTYTLYLLFLEAYRLVYLGSGDTLAAVRFYLGKMSNERVRRDIYAAFDEGTRSLGLLSVAPVDDKTLDRRLIALI